MKENLVSLSLTLDEEDVAVIAALPKTYRYMNPPFAPEWDE
jgi:2,5-diketo-D-gluconate reductase B